MFMKNQTETLFEINKNEQQQLNASMLLEVY